MLFCQNEAARVNVAFYDAFGHLEGEPLFKIVEWAATQLLQMTDSVLPDTSESLKRIQQFLKRVAKRVRDKGCSLLHKNSERFELCSWMAFWLENEARSYATFKRVEFMRHQQNEAKQALPDNVINIDKKVA